MTAVPGATEFVGVLSDTHGWVRPEVLQSLRGATHILHAGDIGSPDVLAALRTLAPVTAVRGNTDRTPPLSRLPLWDMLLIWGRAWWVVHRREDLEADVRRSEGAVVVFGHTHMAHQWTRDGVLWINPGSAGPRRPGTRPSLARVWRAGDSLVPEWVPLEEP